MKQREIKFRAWDKGKMHYFDLSDTISPSLEMELMQYTGLKDKNVVDVYEKDICELEIEFQGVDNEFYKEPPFHHILTGIVKYMPSVGYYLSIFKGIDVDTEESIIYPKRKEIVQYRTKVIGNIYEHKHLLK